LALNALLSIVSMAYGAAFARTKVSGFVEGGVVRRRQAMSVEEK
jgi:hypothetical protein